MNARLLKFYLKVTSPRERGATAVEYGLMVALIAVVIIGAVSLLGKQLSNLFVGVTNQLPIP